MAKFTFLEVHLDGAEFQANAPFSSGTDDEDATVQSNDTDVSEESDGPPVGRLLAALVIFAVTAIAVKKVIGTSSDEPDEEFDDEGSPE